MPLEDVLARIPGLAGYRAQQQFDDRQAQSQLGQLLGVANLMESQKQRQLQQEMQRAQLKQLQDEVARKNAARTGLGSAIDQMFPGQAAIEAPTEEMGGGPGRPAMQDPKAGLLKGMVELDPGGLSDIVKGALGYGARGAGQGASPMLVKMMSDRDRLIAEGKTADAQALQGQIDRLSHGERFQNYQHLMGLTDPSLAAGLAFGGVRNVPGVGVTNLLGGSAPQPAQNVPAAPGRQPLDAAFNEELLKLNAARERGDAEAVQRSTQNLSLIDRDRQLWNASAQSGNAPAPRGNPNVVVPAPPSLKEVRRNVNGTNEQLLFDDKTGTYYRSTPGGRPTPLTDAVRPEITAQDQQNARKHAEEVSAISVINSQLGALEKLATENPRSVAGPASPLVRGFESAADFVVPGSVGLQATTSQQLIRSIIANLPKVGRISNYQQKEMRQLFEDGMSGNASSLRQGIELLRQNLGPREAGTGVPDARTGAPAGGGSDIDALVNKYRSR